MSKRTGIDATANEILRILEDSPDPPETMARSALQQARDAGGGGLRQEYLKDAQKHITRIDARRHPKTVQRLQAEVLALQGRRGDTEIAHVTSNELVIPPSLQTPALMQAIAALAQARGIDPASLFVGSGRNAINPHTGQMEFAEPEEDIESITVRGQRIPQLTDDDVHLLGRMIFTEGAPNWRTPGVFQGPGSTALNRYGSSDPLYAGKSFQEIIRQKGQFQGVDLMKNSQGSDTLWALSEHPDKLEGPNKKAFAEAQRVARALADGTLSDNTGGATRFGSQENGSLPPKMKTDLDAGSFVRARPDIEAWTFLRKPRPKPE